MTQGKTKEQILTSVESICNLCVLGRDSPELLEMAVDNYRKLFKEPSFQSILPTVEDVVSSFGMKTGESGRTLCVDYITSHRERKVDKIKWYMEHYPHFILLNIHIEDAGTFPVVDIYNFKEEEEMITDKAKEVQEYLENLIEYQLEDYYLVVGKGKEALKVKGIRVGSDLRTFSDEFVLDNPTGTDLKQHKSRVRIFNNRLINEIISKGGVDLFYNAITDKQTNTVSIFDKAMSYVEEARIADYFNFMDKVLEGNRSKDSVKFNRNSYNRLKNNFMVNGGMLDYQVIKTLTKEILKDVEASGYEASTTNTNKTTSNTQITNKMNIDKLNRLTRKKKTTFGLNKELEVLKRGLTDEEVPLHIELMDFIAEWTGKLNKNSETGKEVAEIGLDLMFYGQKIESGLTTKEEFWEFVEEKTKRIIELYEATNKVKETKKSTNEVQELKDSIESLYTKVKSLATKENKGVAKDLYNEHYKTKIEPMLDHVNAEVAAKALNNAIRVKTKLNNLLPISDDDFDFDY